MERIGVSGLDPQDPAAQADDLVERTAAQLLLRENEALRDREPVERSHRRKGGPITQAVRL